MNIALLRDMVLWVEKESTKPYQDREWSQGWWAHNWENEPEMIRGGYCGTTYCVAGKILSDAGLLHYGALSGFGIDQSKILAAVEKGEYDFTCLDNNDADGKPAKPNRYSWTMAGSLVLGITWPEGSRLFAGSNTAEDVRKIAGEIAEAHGEVL